MLWEPYGFKKDHFKKEHNNKGLKKGFINFMFNQFLKHVLKCTYVDSCMYVRGATAVAVAQQSHAGV